MPDQAFDREAYLSEKAKLLGVTLGPEECAALAELGRRQEEEAIQLLARCHRIPTASSSRLSKLCDCVCRRFLISVEALHSPSRTKSLVLARATAAWIARKRYRMSYPEIAAALSRADHTTAMGLVEKIELAIKSNDQDVVRDLCAVERMLAEDDG